MKSEVFTYTHDHQKRMVFGIYSEVLSAEEGFVSDADPAGRTLKLYLVSGRQWGDDDDSPMIFAAYDLEEAVAMHERILGLEGADDDELYILTYTLRLGEAISADSAASLKEVVDE